MTHSDHDYMTHSDYDYITHSEYDYMTHSKYVSSRPIIKHTVYRREVTNKSSVQLIVVEHVCRRVDLSSYARILRTLQPSHYNQCILHVHNTHITCTLHAESNICINIHMCGGC